MPTIFDIAKKAKVSVMTVSRVLNNPDVVSDKTIQRIHKIMDNLGYQPSQVARSLVMKRTNTIGVIMPDIKNTYFNSLFRYIEDYASSHDFNLLLCNTDEEPEKEMKYVKLLQSQRADGILIIPCSHSSIEYLDKCGVKYISVDRVFTDLKTDFIVTDHYFGAYEATKYLIKLGHKKIAILRGSGILFPDIERYKGFMDAMNHYKVPLDKDFILNCEFDEMKAWESVEELLSRKHNPTAIFAFNSLMMVGAIKSIRAKNKKIPGNVSLICFDEIPGYEICEPRITHIKQPIEELGNLAIKYLIEKIRSPRTAGVKFSLKPKLVVGNSCRKIN